MGLFVRDEAGNAKDCGSGVNATDYYRLIKGMNDAAKYGYNDGVDDETARRAFNAYSDRFSPEAIWAHNLNR